MGIIGGALYYGILQLLLRIQGKELADYQNINGMASGAGLNGILGTVKKMYLDFSASASRGMYFLTTGSPWQSAGCWL